MMPGWLGLALRWLVFSVFVPVVTSLGEIQLYSYFLGTV